MNGDVIINKIETIKRCMNRIAEVYEGNPKNLEDYTKQDSIVLNLQRTCEASIDLAMHIVSERKLGIPQNSRDAFELLNKHHLIDDDLSAMLKSMIGFRNVAVHDYRAIKVEILQSIIEKQLDDFIRFTDTIRSL